MTINIISSAAAGTSTTQDLYIIPSGATSYSVAAPGILGNDPASSVIAGRRRSLLAPVNPLIVTTPPSFGSVAPAADGSLVYTPFSAVTGTLRDTFYYTVCFCLLFCSCVCANGWLCVCSPRLSTPPFNSSIPHTKTPTKQTKQTKLTNKKVATTSGVTSPTLVTILGDTPAVEPIAPELTTPASTPPVPSDDDYDAVVGTSFTVDVCANDQDGAPAMSNAQSFSIVLTQAPTAGTLSPIASPVTCSFTYTPGASPGIDRLRYKVVSPTAAGTSAVTGVVTFRVKSAPPTRAPRPSNSNGGPQPTVVEAVDDKYSVVKQGSLSIPASQGLLANDKIPNGVTVTALALNGGLSIVGGGSIGSATFLLTGTSGAFTFAPDSADAANTPKTYKQSYMITGSDASTSTADVFITAKPQPVAAVPNQPPVPVDDAYTFQVGGAATTFATSLLANDYDPDSSSGSLSVVTSSFTLTPNTAGTVAVTSAGVLTFTPGSPNVNAPASFTYSIRDGAGLQSTGTATVRIKFTPAPVSGSVTTNTGLLVVPRDDVYSFDTAAATAMFTTGNGVLGNDGLATGVTVTNVTFLNVGVCTPVCKGSPAIASTATVVSVCV